MKQRLLVAAIGVPLLILVLVFLPPLATGILVAAIAGAAAYELLHTACKRPNELYGLTVLYAALTALMVFSITAVKSLAIDWPQILYPAAAFLYLMGLFFFAVRTHGTEHAIPFTDVAVCIVAAFLFPAMYGCIALLRSIGPAFVLMPFVVAFIGDSFSMLGGMAFGHKKFAPNVSPNKTWAGFIAGPIGSALGMVLLCLVYKWVWSVELPIWYLALVGIVANLFGQLGDLSTSLIKREAGIKDYSHIFLTHGGVLDRFDSILFIAPVVYAAVMWMEAVL